MKLGDLQIEITLQWAEFKSDNIISWTQWNRGKQMAKMGFKLCINIQEKTEEFSFDLDKRNKI